MASCELICNLAMGVADEFRLSTLLPNVEVGADMQHLSPWLLEVQNRRSLADFS